MKTSDILQAFHAMPACDRLDLLCRMLHYCVPYEAHFLGTVLVDSSKEHYKSFVSKAEINANRVNYYSGFKDVGLTHEVCEKLCCALAVVHADNHPVAEAVFNLLHDPRVFRHLDEVKDAKMMQDFRLLYVMGVNHPAFTFNQRQLLLYTYLQQMDTMFAEKAKFGFSLSNSMEKTLTSEGESGSYPPEGLKEPAPDAYITRCEVHSVYKRLSDKRYVYMILVEWSDGTQYTVRRTYGDFFSFQTKLLDLFPEEGGQKGKKHPRLIPFLPGKNYSRFLKNKEVAEKRLPELHRYSKELMSLPDRITRVSHVLEFFKPRPNDEKEEYPPLHKITNLYDLVEAGKTRVRVQSEPGMRGSPTHSPMLHHHYDSPLHRAVPTTVSQPNGHVDTPSPRSARTLPPAPVTASQVNSDEGSPSVIPRRPTYPLSNKLKKSENSAFTPIGSSALSQDDFASTATLMASQVSIPHVIPDSSSSASTTPSSSATNTLVSGSSLSAYGRAVTADGPSTAAGNINSSSGSDADRASTTLTRLSAVNDHHHDGSHVQPVATVQSSSSASVYSRGGVPVSGSSVRTGASSHSGHSDGGGEGGARGGDGSQKMSNHVGSSALPHSHLHAMTTVTPNSSSGGGSCVTLTSDGRTDNISLSYQIATAASSGLGASGRPSEAHTLTRAHPDAAEELDEVTSPGLNMEGGSTAWIDTVLAYTQTGSIIQTGSPHHQYLPHTAMLHQVLPPHPQGKTYLHNQTSPTSVVTSSIVSSNISPSPTHSETSTQSGGMPYSPGLIQYPPYSPIPYPQISPLASPIPLVKKTGHRPYGSNVSINRMPTENDTLLMWMKSLRLHKYYSKFENTTFEEMCSLTVEMMKEKGLTEGAAKKLHKKLEELKKNNFAGFSGMPIAPGMTRKPSTCSLPASLLMEQHRMTPSSSCEGLSPTGSTCSLGMVGHSVHHLRRTPTPLRGHRLSSQSATEQQNRQSLSRIENSSVSEDPSAGGGGNGVMIDAAIVKAVPSLSSPPLMSPDSSSTSKVESSFSLEVSVANMTSESPLRDIAGRTGMSTSAAGSHRALRASSLEKSSTGESSCDGGAKVNGPVTGSSESRKTARGKEELLSSWKVTGNVSNSSSNWADEVVSNEEAGHVNRPEWANMSPAPHPSSSSSSTSSSTSSPAVVKQMAAVSSPHSSGSGSGNGGGGGSSSAQLSSSNHSTGPGAPPPHHHQPHSQLPHHHQAHHHHHHHHPSSPQARTVHQIHSLNNSFSDIIPIQTNPNHSSPFHSPPSSSSSSAAASSSLSSSPHVSTSQHSEPHSLPSTTNSHSHPHSHSTSTKQKQQAHIMVTKRNSSSEVPNHSSPVLQAAPLQTQQVFLGGNRAPNIVSITAPPGRSGGGSGGAGTHSWIVRPVLLPNHPVTVIGVPTPNRTQHHQVIHTTSQVGTMAATGPHNGLMRTIPHQTRLPTTATIVPATFVPNQPGGLIVCPPVNINHIQSSAPPPAMCFNCGKRGHLGNSCPGVTMETNNPANFHKKLEKRVTSKRSA